MKPRTLILRTAGTNCDAETAYAFERAGADSVAMHLNEVLASPQRLAEFQILAIPGGFSYGDDISAGKILANQLMHRLRDALHEFVASGKPIIGICNGFQVLLKTDLLPGPIDGRSAQTCTLAVNGCGRFVDRWTHLARKSDKCIWTVGLESIELPIAHGEGRFIPADNDVLRSLWRNDQVALVYTQPDGSPAAGAFPHNPNASVDDIAGICDSTGLVFGLMPHPERHVSGLAHPAWSSRGKVLSEGSGLQIFTNAIRHVNELSDTTRAQAVSDAVIQRR